MSGKKAGGYLVAIGFVLLLVPSAWAQQGSGIAGIVRDTSGAVLPGVTVEASSPALIEKVRSVVTDGEGRYNIINLPPATYSVSFSLAGFNTLRREGVVLTTGFTASINAEMQVGALAETITVTGESPLVDVQNVTQQRILSAEVLEALPTGSTSLASLTTLVPGLTGAQDVGGLGSVQGSAVAATSFHGKTGRKWSFDGMEIMNVQGAGQASFVMNQSMVQETSIETGGAGADSQVSALSVNAIPKQGGNIFTGLFDGMWSTRGMQANNLDDDLRSRGLTTVNRLSYVYNVSGAVGGPIMQDKLWFYSGVRLFDVHSTVANIFYNKAAGSATPWLYIRDESRPAERWESYQDYATRLTWQASARNKVGVYLDFQPRCDCRRPGNLSPEAQPELDLWPQGLYQATWSAPLTNRLLLEAGASMAQSTHTVKAPEGHVLAANEINIVDSATGLSWGAPGGGIGLRNSSDTHRFAERFALSYVTGSHHFKTGFYLGQGVQTIETFLNQSLSYTFNCAAGYDANGLLLCDPTRITMHAGPYTTRNRLKADLGVYAQDQWTRNRLSLSYGVRFEYLNAYVAPQSVPATRFLPAREFDKVEGVPLWKDISPRFGAAYDLFGDGRTALKFSLGRYSGVTAVDIANSNNPIVTSQNTVTRNWTDDGRNGGIAGDFVPQCVLENFQDNGECGPTTNANFGSLIPTRTRWDEDVLRGWGVRDYFWDIATEVQQQLGTGVSVYAGYYRNWDGNNRVTDNEAWVPSDFSTFCVTAPSDPRLPNGGGYEICGLADIAPAKLRASQNVVKSLEDAVGREGGRVSTNNFVAAGFNARLGGNARMGGGIDTGRQVNDNCYTVDSPQSELLTWGYDTSARDCDAPLDWMATMQVKINGSYTFPRDIVASFVYQNLAGQVVAANYAMPNVEVRTSHPQGLNRQLAACGANQALSCSSRITVPLVVPNSLFEPRQNRLDLRVGKTFRVGNYRIQGNLDLYNALNGNSIVSRNNNWGVSWGQALSVMDARMLQVSGNVSF